MPQSYFPVCWVARCKLQRTRIAILGLAKIRVNPRPIEGGDTSGQRASAAGVVVSYLSGTIHSYSQRVEAVVLTATKVRIYPTPEQADFLNQQFGAVRFTYNKALHIISSQYK
ncbi:helix-turn-helix domain-containing protein, partial [Halomonas sp. GFAJ-1]|uniref:helix-turn-helix domain-containing protein n=1 Tax=Halomonas sp. GFAJ-1 TaxID=1118153 RepID=UPI002E1B2CDE